MSTENLIYSQKGNASYAVNILSWAAAAWLCVATVGQWIFGIYILLFYGRHTVRGDFEKLNEALPHGYVAGDWKGNLVVSIHVLLAAVIVIGGPLQLIPKIRAIFPAFHRRLGRTYVVTAIIVSVAGLIMVWTHGAVGDLTQDISISIQAIYIVSFALLTIRYARARQIDKHRAWALRLFMVTNGVWFFRIGLMCWLLVNGGPVGFDTKTFSGPFLTVLSVFTYAIPLSLIVLEMYFYSLKKQDRAFSLFTAAVIFILTILMCIGIAGATMGMWLPRFS